MSTDGNNTTDNSMTLEAIADLARSNKQWDTIYRYLFLHPKDFFVVLPNRRWPIAHQVVYHGDVDLFKRILALFSDDQINITSKSADHKTLLEVAIEREKRYPLMCTYVKHLFAQNELMEAAKTSNWRSMMDILDHNPELVNEKPPYSPYFLLHYVVEKGDAEILQDLLGQYQCLTNVLNNKNETPLEMAMRLNKYPMTAILEPRTIARPNFMRRESETESSEREEDRSDERSTYAHPFQPPDNPAHYQTRSSVPAPPPKPYNPTTPPCIGFGNMVLNIDDTGDFKVEQQVLYNSTRNPPKQPPRPPQQPPQSEFRHVYTNKTIVREESLINVDPPSPPTPQRPAATSNEQVLKNLTCFITKKIFVDPVIASDGQTYERADIAEWVNFFHSSPITGAPMDATFRDNTEVKQIIQSMQRRN